jgi:hypothetical protein
LQGPDGLYRPQFALELVEVRLTGCSGQVLHREAQVSTWELVGAAVELIGEPVQSDRAFLERVFGNTDRAELRLITCGGPFDPRKHSYEDTIVVLAHLTSTQRAPA